jgi:hypothetical protein
MDPVSWRCGAYQSRRRQRQRQRQVPELTIPLTQRTTVPLTLCHSFSTLQCFSRRVLSLLERCVSGILLPRGCQQPSHVALSAAELDGPPLLLSSTVHHGTEPTTHGANTVHVAAATTVSVLSPLSRLIHCCQLACLYLSRCRCLFMCVHL